MTLSVQPALPSIQPALRSTWTALLSSQPALRVQTPETQESGQNPRNPGCNGICGLQMPVYMNSMHASFAGGKIFQTDYFTSRACEEGRAWLAVEGGSWHVLLPQLCRPVPTVAYARPVTDSLERDRWWWA